MGSDQRRRSRWWGLTAVMAIAAGVVAVVSTVTITSAAIQSPFSPPDFATQENGAIALVGNSQMTCPTAAPGCTTAQSAAPITSGSNTAINNDYTMTFLDLDGLAGTQNSTSADLNLPAGAGGLYAQPGWGGRGGAGTGGGAAG